MEQAKDIQVQVDADLAKKAGKAAVDAIMVPPWVKEDLQVEPPFPDPPYADSSTVTNWFYGVALQKSLRGDGPPVRYLDKAVHMPAEFFEEALEKLRPFFGRVVQWHSDPDSSTDVDYHFNATMIWPHAAGTVRYHKTHSAFFSFDVHTTDATWRDELYAVLQSVEKPLPEVKRYGICQMLGKTMRGLQLFHIGHAGVPLQRQNYAKGVLEGYDKIKTDLSSANPPGRFGVLTGPPGTGKTFLLRGLMEEVLGVFILVPSSMIETMGSPELVPTLLELRANNRGLPLILASGAGAEAREAPRRSRTCSTPPTASSVK